MHDEQEPGAHTHVTEELPIVRQLLRTAKVASATLILGSLIGGVVAVTGWRFIGPPQDIAAVKADLANLDTSLNRRIEASGQRTRSIADSVFKELSAARSDIALLTDQVRFSSYVQCVQLRRHDPDLRPGGCDAAEARQAGRPR